MPARYFAVRRALGHFGITVKKRAGKGSHTVVADAKGHSYTLPLHHGERTDLSDVYLKGLCRAFELDWEAFKKKL